LAEPNPGRYTGTGFMARVRRLISAAGTGREAVALNA
jgi:hypothetical protein